MSQRRLTIKTPTELSVLSRKQNSLNKNETYTNSLRIAKAQLKRYENDPDWNTSEDRNEAIEFLKYTKIPELLRKIENRKPTCQRVTNAVTGACSIQRHRTRKNGRSRKLTRRIR